MLTTELCQYVLSNSKVRVGILNLGATITSIETPDRSGRMKNIVAGFADLERYWQNEYYLGCLVGRCANRIRQGRFRLDGTEIRLSVNNDGNHLHGGFEGLHRKMWKLHSRIDSDAGEGIVLEYMSPDGEEGYPGNLRIQVTYLLNRTGSFSIGYTAVTDKSTPVNLTNHTYFNLSGFERPTIEDHQLRVFAGTYTEKNELNLPTGRILPLAGTPMDFSISRRIGDRIRDLPLDMGYDHNYVLDRTGQVSGVMGTGAAIVPAAGSGIVPAAELYDPVSGRSLRVLTDRPGLQVYTANWWDGVITGRQQVPYVQHGAVALETQAFPDSPNHPSFPDIILRPGEVYDTTSIFEFNTK
ncbi:MAG TPA: aldose epimerase family protein [Puia sp.]|jgi:aldose 1-epimerase|nr:aldose epimerase family protein [Puia sp.]